MKTYVFDIDGTICLSPENGEYEKSVPIEDRIQKINKLFDEGNIIIFHTARGMRRNNNDASAASFQLFETTKNQLNRWNVKYHQLLMGKPGADVYVDDKGVKDEDFFRD